MSLRWSEIATHRPDDIALEARRVRIRAEVSKNGRERSVGFPHVMHVRFRALTLKADPDGLSIPDLAEPKNQESWFLAARRKAGPTERLVFHDLRHSAASFAVSADASVKVGQNMLGHSSAAMTLDVYSDLFDTTSTTLPSGLADAVKKLSSPEIRMDIKLRMGEDRPITAVVRRDK